MKITRLEKLYYRITGKLEYIYWQIRYFFQRLFRKNHLSDYDAFECVSSIVHKVYPLVKNYYETKRVGYPMDFIEWEEGCGYTKEEYEEYKQSGDILGGGPEAWEKVLQEIIFAFEWFLCENNKKLKTKLKKENGDWEAKLEKNKSCSFFRKIKDSDNSSLITDINELTDEEKASLKEKDIFYFDSDLYNSLQKRADAGFKLFGKYFQNLWD